MRMRSRGHPLRFVWLIAMAVIAGSGCNLIYPGQKENGPVACVPAEIPRELSKVSLPDYVVEPPDVLTIDAINLVPRSPYHIQPFDVLGIVSQNVPGNQPIAGEYVVQVSGDIQLGFDYGSVRVVGLTVEEAEAAIRREIEKIVQEPSVWVSLNRLASQQEIAGEHLVAPDGKVNLGTYGRVRVVGLTIDECRAAIESHLATYLESPKVAVDVFGYNSKVYYVITQGAGLGDAVFIQPVKGNETALDAVGQINGLQSISSTRMWIARPGSNDCGGDQILPIDWLAITQRGDVSTNYQLLPGDRVYVSEDKLVAFDTHLAKLVSPIERALGVTLLATQTAQRLAFFQQSGIRGNTGF